MVVVAIMIAAHVMLTLLVVTVPKKDVHMDVVAKNALDVVLVTVAQDPANVQMDMQVLLVNASSAQMIVAAKVHAIPRQVRDRSSQSPSSNRGFSRLPAGPSWALGLVKAPGGPWWALGLAKAPQRRPSPGLLGPCRIKRPSPGLLGPCG